MQSIYIKVHPQFPGDKNVVLKTKHSQKYWNEIKTTLPEDGTSKVDKVKLFQDELLTRDDLSWVKRSKLSELFNGDYIMTLEKE